MNEGFDVIVKRGFLKVVRRVESFFLVEKNVLVEVFSSDKSESQMGNVLVQRKRQVFSHLAQNPVENHPNRQRVSHYFVRVLVVFNQVNKCLLLFVLRLCIQQKFVDINSVKILQMEHFLRHEWVTLLVKVLVPMLVKNCGGQVYP